MDYALSSLDLNNFISKDEILLPMFQGVYASNRIPEHNPLGKFFIINTEPSWSPGKHWVSIYFPFHSLPEFFDSLGKCPSFYSNYILDFLIENSAVGFVYNYKRIQNVYSSSCGMYCLYFAYHRSRNVYFKDILKKFSSSNLGYNENIVQDFVASKRSGLLV